MEIFILDKAIDNEKLDLDMDIYQLNKEKEKLSQSLKRRKEIVNQMNDLLYIEEIIEEFHPSCSTNEENDAIKEILAKNGSLQEEVRKLRREQEIQSIRLCEIMEEKNETKEKLEGKDNEIQHLCLQRTDFINQLTNANEEIVNLRSENERLQNDLNFERQLNERMMKSQVDMNQLNEKNIYRQKGKVVIGYKEEVESSNQGSQKN